MALKKIFEKVSLVVPIEQRRFLNSFEDSVSELEAMYGKYVFRDKESYKPPESIDDEIAVRELFYPAIVDNVLYLTGKEEVYKSEFLRKAHEAYLKYWNEDIKGRKLRKAVR